MLLNVQQKSSKRDLTSSNGFLLSLKAKRMPRKARLQEITRRMEAESLKPKKMKLLTLGASGKFLVYAQFLRAGGITRTPDELGRVRKQIIGFILNKTQQLLERTIKFKAASDLSPALEVIKNIYKHFVTFLMLKPLRLYS